MDGVLLVSETDAAAIQASQHLTRVLTKYIGNRKTRRTRGRMVGFVINKAFADPTQVASASTSFFKTRYLGPIPFDFETTRRFIFGEFPSWDGVFSIHVQAIAEKLFTSLEFPLSESTWKESDYESLSLRDINAVIGGRLCAAIVLIVLYINISSFFFPSFIPNINAYGVVGADVLGAAAGVAGSLDSFRKQVGRTARTVANRIEQILEKILK